MFKHSLNVKNFISHSPKEELWLDGNGVPACERGPRLGPVPPSADRGHQATAQTPPGMSSLSEPAGSREEINDLTCACLSNPVLSSGSKLYQEQKKEEIR